MPRIGSSGSPRAARHAEVDRGHEPPARGRFVGRARELAELHSLFAEGAALVTITGFPGIGKTALARRYAELSGKEFAGGSWFVDLAEARSLDELCTAVARGLDVPLATGSTAQVIEQLGAAIEARADVLIVLDNFEQLVDDAPTAIDRWLEMAPAAALLVTSRERLRLGEEHCLTLEPLPLPPADESDAERLADSEAVQLFVRCARAERHDYVLSAEDAAHISNIVRALDGLPLAIELCAARVNVLGAKQLRELLAHRFEVLARAPRGRTTRQATLRGALDWSWELLETWERAALAQCSVFRGGFSLDAANAILDLGSDGGGAPTGALRVVEVLQALCDKSLLVATEARRTPGERRYRLYESIREYAAERLDQTGGPAAANARHAHYFLAAGAKWARAVHGPGGSDALGHLVVEADNVLAVHDRAGAAGGERLGEALDVLLHLAPVFFCHGAIRRYADLLDRAITACNEDEALAPRLARAWIQLGHARRWYGDMLAAAAAVERGVGWAERCAEMSESAVGHALLGFFRCIEGAWDAAEDHMCAAERASDAANDAHVHGEVCLLHALVLTKLGRGGDAAEARAQQALAAFRAVGCAHHEATVIADVAGRCVERGDLTSARAHYQRAIVLLQMFDNQRLEAWVRVGLGVVATEQCRYDEASVLFDEALRLARKVGAHLWEAYALGFAGHLDLERGRCAQARQHYRDATALFRQAHHHQGLGVFIAADGAAAARTGSLDEAARLFAEAEELLSRAGRPTDVLVVAILRQEIDLALARSAESTGDATAAGARRAAVRAWLAEAVANASSSLPDEVRFALRVVRAGLEPGAAVANAPQSADDRMVAWTVDPEGRALWAPGGDRVDLRRRGPLHRIVRALVDARLHSPGAGLSTERLVQAGWPGQRMAVESGANRVRVAMSTLRRMGLRELLVTRDDGYLLDPQITVKFA
jgi:predicted ATPase